MGNLNKVVYLTNAQAQELFTNGTITVGGVTVTYSADDLYVTPSGEVTDVQVNGSSIVNNGVANITKAIDNSSNLGIVGTETSFGIRVNESGKLYTYTAGDNELKLGTQGYKPIVPANQHKSVFYGLAKVAGNSDQSSSNNSIGVYTDDAKDKIQKMLGVQDLIAESDSSTATAAHAVGSLFIMDGKLYKTTSAIGIGDAIVSGTNCTQVTIADAVPLDVQVNGTSVISNGVANIPVASYSNFGVIKTDSQYGITPYNSKLMLVKASDSEVKSGSIDCHIISPSNQHKAVYYGLSKLAGVDLANETVTVGTYPESSKTAIQSMLGVRTSLEKADDTYQSMDHYYTSIEIGSVDGTTGENTESNQRARTIGFFDIDSFVKCYSSSSTYVAYVFAYASDKSYIGRYPSDWTTLNITRENILQTYSTAKYIRFAFKRSDVAVISSDDIAALRSVIELHSFVTDVQINGLSVVTGNVANIPIASENVLGAVKVKESYGIKLDSDGKTLKVRGAWTSEIKDGTHSEKPITPYYQQYSVFYGLSKAAGVDLRNETVTFGVYPETSKSAIRSMIGVESGISLVETVSGTTPTITGQPNVRYMCGEVSTISITPPANGTIDVIFTSGSTPSVLTIPNTVKFPSWFDATSLDASTIYEIMITDGVYGAVSTWAS